MRSFFSRLWAWLNTTPDLNYGIPSRLLANQKPSPYAVMETETGAFYPTVQVDTMRYRLRKNAYSGLYVLDQIQYRNAKYYLVECSTIGEAEDVLQDYINQQPQPVKIKKIHEYRTTDPR